MAERLWIPADYVDEVCPPGRASPDAWIGAPAGEVWWLAPCEADEAPDTTLTPGKIVEFSWVERFGGIDVEIRDDGTHVAHGPVPDGVNTFAFGTDVIADTLDDFVQQWRGYNMEFDGDDVVEVQMARWSDQDERFQFDVGERGPRFIRPNPPREPAQPRQQGGGPL